MASDTEGPGFTYTDLLPLLEDPYETTEFRRLETEGVSTVDGPGGRAFLEVDPKTIRILTATAMRDIAHLFRPGHLAQLQAILHDLSLIHI